MADDEEGTSSSSQPKRLKTGLRKYSKLPIEVCESHEDALYHIQRAIASKYLPFQGITMVHLDSHPDLTIPMKMPADLVFNPEKLFEQISIADWILPAVYAGHISRLVWVKPEWADQMEEKSQQKFCVGKDKDTGYLRVSCIDDYYLEELLYTPQDQLENVQELEVIMFTLNSTKNSSTAVKDEEKVTKTDGLMADETECLGQPQSNSETNCEDEQQGKNTAKQTNEMSEVQESLLEEENFTLKDSFNIQDIERQGNGETEGSVCLSELLKTLLSDNEPYVLDVDMDFFSTKNPFKELFNQEEFQSLRQIYDFIPPTSKHKEDLDKCTEARASQLACIDSTFEYLKAGGRLDCSCEGDTMVDKQLLNLLEEMKGYGGGEEPDLEMVHSAGMTIDLPHHVSTKQQINSLLTDVFYTLQSIPKPTMVTMARSAHDDYTPPNQVEYIQSSLINILGSVYGMERIDIHLHYKDQG